MPLATLQDLKEENDDEKRQAYYAGGQGQNGGGSGQEILDPREFMNRARHEMGAQTNDEYQAQQPAAASSSFVGQGQSLAGATHAGAPAPPSQEQAHTITFWQNGFSVDDGPLRQGSDPENAAFLAAINRGQIPAELAAPDGADRDVHIIDKSGEDYKPPPMKPFGGSGRSMRETPAEGAAPAAPAADAAELVVDAAQPTTTLQIRLADGSRKVVKANQSHTVLQLTAHVATFNPGVAFTLGTAFPRKTLTEMDKTLAEAGVLNETLVQSLA